MRTTIDLDRKLLDEVVALTKERNKGKAVSRALEDFIRRRKVEELRALSGKIDLIDNWRELEELELEELRQLE